MSNSNDIPTSKLSPPPFSSSRSRDIIELTPQFSTSNERFEPRSASDGSHSFQRTGVPDNNQSNAMNHPPSNRRAGNILFKTRICTNYSLGTCRYGESCTFAHGVDEIKQPPPNRQELVGPRTKERLQLGGSQNIDEKIIRRMQLCKKYCDGEICPYGDNCIFLHEKTRETSAISIATSHNLEGSTAGSKPERGNYWKTKICFSWKNTGSCPFGDGCSFAHGNAELQVLGGGIEAEAAVAIANSTKTVISTLPTTGSSANYAPTALPANVPAAAEMEEEKKAKKELLRKKLNKINRIYGDWIDDLPPEP